MAQPPEWAAEIELGPDDARALIAAQFPPLASASLRAFGNGWDNTAYLVDERFVFRFPRRTIAAPLIAREIAFLPGLAPQLPAAISAPIFAGVPSGAYPWRFAGYALIDGIPLSELDARGPKLGAQLGAFLRALHAIDPQPLIDAGLPFDEIGRFDHEKRFPMAVERLTYLHERGLLHDPATLIATLAAIAPRPDEAVPRVVHGDLYALHVLADPDGSLRGIIDWGDIHAGDVALDLTIAETLFDGGDRAAFDAAYGPIDARTRERARWRAIYAAAMTGDYAHRTGRASLLAFSVEVLRRLAAAPPQVGAKCTGKGPDNGRDVSPPRK